MKSILLDTHVWIWFVKGDSTLKSPARQVIEDAYNNGTIALSAISIWETAMLVSKHKLILSLPVLDWIKQAIRSTRCELIDLSTDIAVESCQLPDGFIGDPAGRIIIATARLKKLTLLTRDKHILNYGKYKYVSTMKV